MDMPSIMHAYTYINTKRLYYNTTTHTHTHKFNDNHANAERTRVCRTVY